VSVIEETTPQPKIREPLRINWNSANIAGFAESIPCIRRPRSSFSGY
jgi:hypothetical protein